MQQSRLQMIDIVVYLVCNKWVHSLLCWVLYLKALKELRQRLRIFKDNMQGEML